MSIGPKLPPSAESSSVSNYGASLSPEEFAREIDHNIKLLCQNAQNKKLNGEDIDAFRNFFQKDLETLKKKNFGLGEVLEQKLIEFDLIRDVFDITISGRLHLVDPKTSLSKYAQKHYPKDGMLKKGANALSYSLDIMPIKGDGHCLFRSIGVGLTQQFLAMSQDEAKKYLDTLAATIKKYKNPKLTESFQKVRAHLENLAHKPQNALQLFNNQTQSDDFVSFLRQLACSYNRSDPVRYKQVQTIVPGLGLGWRDADHYLTALADMKQAKYGEDLEVSALAEALRLKINVNNVLSHGKQNPSGATTQFGPNTKREINLLYFPLHYALGVKV